MRPPNPREAAPGPAFPVLAPVPSPCVGLCRIDASSGLCRGCARTGAEIGGWASSPDLRRRIWAELPARRSALGLTVHRLAWTLADLCAFVEGTFGSAGGHWMPGAFADFAAYRVDGDERPTFAGGGACFLARGRHAAMRIHLDDRVRALAFDGDASVGTVVLAVTSDHAVSRTADAMRPLGRDLEAISTGGSSEILYDLGLGAPAVSLALRTGDPRTIAILDRLAGRRWLDLPASMREAVLGSSPTRVLRHPLGRFEAYGPCPLADDVASAGSPPSEHDAWASAGPRWTFPDLPEGYVPCAVHTPAGVERDGAGTRP